MMIVIHVVCMAIVAVSTKRVVHRRGDGPDVAQARRGIIMFICFVFVCFI
jgi:hypothetical protein